MQWLTHSLCYPRFPGPICHFAVFWTRLNTLRFDLKDLVVIGMLNSNERPHDKTNKMACVPSEDSEQPGHSPSLISLCFAHEESLDP